MNVPILLLRTAGTNCEKELAVAFEQAGGRVSLLHVNEVIHNPKTIQGFAILGLPGGFSYGDDIASGRIFANQLVHHLAHVLAEFVDRGGLIIGICNGFQILVKCGLLPGGSNSIGKQTATLTHNDSGRFQCEWVSLAAESKSKCLWTKGLTAFPLPIAHGEGKFVAPDILLDQLEADGQVALRYRSHAAGGTLGPQSQENPNGSLRSIAGVCDPTGRVFGLMPHPERFISTVQAPVKPFQIAEAPGLTLIKNGVSAVR